MFSQKFVIIVSLHFMSSLLQALNSYFALRFVQCLDVINLGWATTDCHLLSRFQKEQSTFTFTNAGLLFINVQYFPSHRVSIASYFSKFFNPQINLSEAWLNHFFHFSLNNYQ